MKKSISNPNLLSMAAASSSSTSHMLMGTLQGSKKIPDVPFVSTAIKIGNVDCCLHTYNPDATFSSASKPPKALVVFLHGWNAHGTFPTTKILADLMLSHGYAFMAPDLPGHGMSSGFAGLRGFLESGEKMVDITSGIIDYAYRDYLERVSIQKGQSETACSSSPGLKMFVVGSSMGGNLSLQASLRNKDISGVILLAPMLRIRLPMPPITRFFLNLWATALPTAPFIPIIKKKNYRCPNVYAEVENDLLKPHQDGDRARFGSAATLVSLVDSLEANFERVTCPCFVMVADEDTTVDNQGAIDLAERASSTDMTLRRYPALHGLMGEPSPLVDRMQIDMITWLDERCHHYNDQPIRSLL